MKKFCTFLSLMLLFFTGGLSLSAQDEPDLIYEVGGSVTEIVPGQDYVLRGGCYAGFEHNRYLGASSFSDVPNAESIYRFVEVGTTTIDGVGELPTYALWNVSQSAYLNVNNGYSRSISDAFIFTAALAKYGNPPASWGETPRSEFYNMVGEDMQPGAEGATFVFCQDSESTTPTYITYYSISGVIQHYYNINDWFVCTVTSREQTVREKFDAAFNEVFPNGFDASAYTVGTTPGCVTQEGLDAMNAAYEAAFAASGDLTMSDEALQAVIDQMYAAREQLQASYVQVTPGYYIMKSQRSQDAVYDDGTNARCTTGYTVPDVLTPDDARYVWEIIATEDGRFQMRNYETDHYLNAGGGTSVIFTTGTTPSATFNFPIITGRYFGIQDQNGNYGHCDASMQFVQWNSTGAGNQFEFIPVSADALEAIAGDVEHNKLTDALESLVEEVTYGKMNYLYDSDVTFDDQYAMPGLADPALMSTNAGEPNEGYAIENQFTRMNDNNVNTYFHTSWSNSDLKPQSGRHWVQVDLGKAVQKLFVKFSDRHNNRNNTPRRLALVAPADDPMAADWTDTLYKDTIIYQYRTNFTNNPLDSTTAVIRVDLGKPVQYLRFVVTKTGHPSGGMSPNGSGPFWNVSELRFYEDGGDNPLYLMIPEEVRNALDQQLTIAEAALADSSATQETYDALEAALEAFYNAYPDPTALNNRLDDARTLLEGAEEGDEYGYFQSGAIAEFQTALGAIESEIEGQNLTLTQLDEYMDRVNAVIDAFNAKLNVPEDGVYYIQSTSDGSSAENYIYVTNAGDNGEAYWGYGDAEDLGSRLDAMWYVSHRDDGTVSLRNLGTGRYIGNLYAGTEEPDTIDLSQHLPMLTTADDYGLSFTFSGTPGSFKMEFASGYSMNANPSGPIVNWTSEGTNGNFAFVPVEEYEGIHTVDISANRMQVISLPFELDPVLFSSTPYRVIGQKARETDGESVNYVQLAPYDDIIPAGTPFIINETDGLSTLMVGLVPFDAVEFATTTEYVYEPVNQNGLVSAITEITPKQGEGLLLDNLIRISNGTSQVAAGSGYFQDNIPVTEEDGDLELMIEGTITAIGGVVTGDAEAANVDVYTLSGVKLRSNVKAADATKGLPAGLYIVGGKKVLVK